MLVILNVIKNTIISRSECGCTASTQSFPKMTAWCFLLYYLNLSGTALSTALHHRVSNCSSILVHTPAPSILPALLRFVGTVLITLGLEQWQRDLDQTCSLLLALSQRCWGKNKNLILSFKVKPKDENLKNYKRMGFHIWTLYYFYMARGKS